MSSGLSYQLVSAAAVAQRLDVGECDVADLHRLIELGPTGAELAEHLTFTRTVEQGAPVYQATDLRQSVRQDAAAVLAELHWVLGEGPGVFAIAGAFDHDVISGASEQFEALIATEKEVSEHAGDHFAVAGANDRVWNALEKLALQSPEVFVDYYRNDMVALGALAWLGPGYLITSQINVVNPGGAAQQPHRDYHLGFMTGERAVQYPMTAHLVSPALTLQGAVAHCDMPIESGPTMYLPHSQKYALGYLAWRQEEFKDYFAEHHVQLQLGVGDLVFFNPALFHGAGANVTGPQSNSPSVRRMANLLQISSAFGRTMESIDHIAVSTTIYPALRAAAIAGVPIDELANVVAAATDGYPFPTNLDRDQPVGGLTPPSQYDIVMAALEADVDIAELRQRLDAHRQRRATGTGETP